MAACAAAGARRGAAAVLPHEGVWRTYEITTRVHILRPVGATRVWLPRPLRSTPFQRLLSEQVYCDGAHARSTEHGVESLGVVWAEFAGGVEPALEYTARVATRDWSVKPRSTGQRQLPRNDGAFLRPTRYIPTDGIVRQTAAAITRGADTDEEKARLIYDWVVEHTHRDPKTRGCGVGDIRPMLEGGDPGGKCADLSALFVGLARASGLPARDVYGLRVAPSALEDRSLGTKSEVVTKAQHCRAEVFLDQSGWVPVDPADVRKVMLEEAPGELTLTDAKVQRVRSRLFGAWEMNWIAYNYAQDVTLPGAGSGPLPFFMYPQAETAAGRLDSLSPEDFTYEITARAVEG